MAVPRLASAEGAYWYLVAAVLGTALLVAGYLVLVVAGPAPPPEKIVGYFAVDL